MFYYGRNAFLEMILRCVNEFQVPHQVKSGLDRGNAEVLDAYKKRLDRGIADVTYITTAPYLIRLPHPP